MDADQHAQFDAMEQQMMAHPAVDCPVLHEFFPSGPGLVLYVRTVTFPAGTLVTGHEHKYHHPWTMARGLMEVIGDGDTLTVLSGPCSGITEPGTRRVAKVHEETDFTTYHVVPAELDGDPDACVRYLTVERHHLDGMKQPEPAALPGGGS